MAKKLKKLIKKQKTPTPKRSAPSFRKLVLPNGIKILTEAHPQNRGVACSVWVDRGTRHETENEAGLAHFVEHLVFKRTKKRSAYKISRDMEAVGGDLNAYTSRENTAFVTHSLSEHLDLSIDVISDLVCRPSFDPGDIKKEKQVVLQEIHMAEDQLEDTIFDKFFERFYADSALGKPILGSVDSIENMDRKRIVDFHSKSYTAENIMVSIAGNIDHDQVIESVLKHLKPVKAKRPSKPSPTADAKLPTPNHFRKVIRKPSEQVHIVMGYPSIDFKDRHRLEAVVVSALLGGGMTSRLYQKVREEKGLVYSIFSQLTTFADVGLETIYAATEAKHAPTVIELILKELKKLKKAGIKKADLDLFKTQVKGSILLGADDIENRMNSLAVNEMMFGRYRGVDEVVRDIEAVTLDSVHDFIETKFLIERPSMLLMGALPEVPTEKW
ncbi:MAG: insulinase family protein, partial [Proteobacteria bacterium]